MGELVTLSEYKTPPHNFEAEQALLGAILVNNEAYWGVAEFLRPEHFADAVHGMIYEACADLVDKGRPANPVTLKRRFDAEPELEKIGGVKYLARLAGSSVTIINAPDYGRIVFDLWQKRMLIALAQDIEADAYDPASPRSASGLIVSLDERLSGIASEAGQGGPKPLQYYLKEAIGKCEEAYKNQGRIIGVATGWARLDGMLAGMQDGDLVVVAGRPGMGKTDVACNIAFNAAHAGKRVLFASFEMAGFQISQRLLARMTGISAQAQRQGALDANDWSRLIGADKTLGELPITINDLADATVSRVRAHARRLKRRQGLDLIIIDYLQRMSTTRRFNNEVEALSHMTKGLKSLAKEAGAPVVLLSQLSRAVEGRDSKRPVLSDLRGSGSIEQDADVVMFAYREDYYLERNEPVIGAKNRAAWEEQMDEARGRLDLIVAKQRNGPIGTVKLYYDPARSWIANLNERPADAPAELAF